jgi:hypothetical protein
MHALLYLELQSRANAVHAAVRRLREPRYAIGAVVMVAYLWLVFGRRVLLGNDESSRAAFGAFGAFLTGDFAAVALLALIAWGWIFGGERAALAFNEAEVAWLFPAPLTRPTLVHYRLLKAQLGIVFGALLYSVLAIGTGRPFGQRFLGLFIVLAFNSLHGVAGAFTRERLVAFGLGDSRRRVAIGALLLAVAGATAWSLQGSGAAPPPAPRSGLPFVDDVVAALAAPPLAWVLAPFRWVVAPLRATSAGEFTRALGPALALLAAHYAWAMRTIVGFEEASAALAEKRAATLRAVRGGRGIFALRKHKARSEPFALAPRGRVELAFLWQRLIAMGSWATPRSLLALASLPIAAAIFMLGASGWEHTLRFVTIGALIFTGYGLLLAPALVRGSLAQLLERVDLVRSYPLRGWQVVLGELLGSIALIGLFECTLVSVAAIGSPTLVDDVSPALVVVAWGVAMALLPPLVGLLLGAQLGVQLALPAWFQPGASRAGLELGGQRLLFVFGSLIAFLVALVPASLVGAVAGGVAQFATGSRAGSLAYGGAAAAAVVLAEFAVLVRWLGHRFESIDLASDLPR